MIDLSQDEQDRLGESRCPDCGCTIFRPGPRGGAAQNIECAQCKSRFNVAWLRDGEFIMAQRIPSEKDGGGEWREDMFPRVLE